MVARRRQNHLWHRRVRSVLPRFPHNFLKPEDRVEGGAQVAIVNPDGSGFEELTAGTDNNAFPSFAPDGKRFVYRTFTKMATVCAS